MAAQPATFGGGDGVARLAFTKEEYRPPNVPRKIKQIAFSLMSPSEIVDASELHVHEHKLYQMPERTPKAGGVLDPRLGVSNKKAMCETCGNGLQHCTGHWGYVQLALPVFHVGYFKATLQTLQCICKRCGRALLGRDERAVFLRRFRAQRSERVQREAAFRRVLDRCKRVRACPWCGSDNGVVKKAPGTLKILHDPLGKAAGKIVDGAERRAADRRAAARDVGGWGKGGAAAGAGGPAGLAGGDAAGGAADESEPESESDPSEDEGGAPPPRGGFGARGAPARLGGAGGATAKAGSSPSSPKRFFPPPLFCAARPAGVPFSLSSSLAGGSSGDDLGQALARNEGLRPFLNRALDDLTPLRVLTLFVSVLDEDLELLDLAGRPEDLLLRVVPVPPVAIRPSVEMDGGAGGSNEDDVTVKLMQIVEVNALLRQTMVRGNPAASCAETWDYLQVQCAMLINSDLPGLSAMVPPQGKPMRGFVQRLKGKQGRFRGNLSGKRVDFSGRTVISPDPNLAVHEVALPVGMARVLTYPERVHDRNIAKLRARVLAGAGTHPGAVFVQYPGGDRVFLKYGDRRRVAANLRPGDVVERHVDAGDIVLFNRQPSLHRQSIMAHRVVVTGPWRTLRFNECACAPYNADFDGDEMNVHVPQTEEARAEAASLAGVAENLCTPKNGEILVAATQDFLTSAHLVTSRDAFFSRQQVAQLVGYATGGRAAVDLPAPAILAPLELWTGKQVFSLMLRPSAGVAVAVTLETREKACGKGAGCMDPNDGFVIFRNGELLCGRLGKGTLGGGNKSGLFQVLAADYSAAAAAEAMSRLARLSARAIGELGFSIGVDDVAPVEELRKAKERAVAEGYGACEGFIAQYAEGSLELQPGCDAEASLEAAVTGVLNGIRERAAGVCLSTLTRHNSPLIMATCGSKGSPINIAQMVACVGQQSVSGKRAPDGFRERSLPHFPRGDKTPEGKGFVASSFYSGLSPTEFFFHTMAGREGLVDTAVKTAETGYMSRRLMKALEDLSVHYDGSVRNAAGALVQRRYGEDGMDPATMEGDDGEAVALKMVLATVKAVFPNGANPAVDRAIAARRAAGASGLCPSVSDRPASPTSVLASPADMDPADVTETSGVVLDAVWRSLRAGAGGEPDSPGSPGSADAVDAADAAALMDEDAPAASGDAAAAVADRLDPTLVPLPSDFRAAALAALAAARLSAPEGSNGDGGRPSPAAPAGESASASMRKLMDRDEGGFCSPAFGGQVSTFLEAVEGAIRLARASVGLPADSRGPRGRELLVEDSGATPRQLAEFVSRCAARYERKRVEPGATVGAVGAQSIGEPGTQMTLKTFHFAGVASMNITLGVPRLKEIINAAKTISTPLMQVSLAVREDEAAARLAKGRLERTELGGVAERVELELTPTSCGVRVRLDGDLIRRLQLDDVTPEGVRLAILDAPKLRLKPEHVRAYEDEILVVPPQDSSAKPLLDQLRSLEAALPKVVVGGVPSVERAVLTREGGGGGGGGGGRAGAKRGKNAIRLLVEGTGLLAVMGSRGVDGVSCTSNHVTEVAKVLGIEAARGAVISEIQYTMGSHGMAVDPRHVQLLADTMTHRGEVLGITRFGIAKMKDSVLMLASFEKTTDHLFDAAIHGRVDDVVGVSESIIMGIPMPTGTGIFKIVQGTAGRSAHEGVRGLKTRPGPVLA